MTPEAADRIRQAFAAAATAVIEEIDSGPGGNGAPDELLSAEQACQALGGIARSTLYSLTTGGSLRSVSVGRRRFWARSYIAEFVADQERR